MPIISQPAIQCACLNTCNLLKTQTGYWAHRKERLGCKTEGYITHVFSLFQIWLFCSALNSAPNTHGMVLLFSINTARGNPSEQNLEKLVFDTTTARTLPL